jgi:protein associated with RNAse G/E
MEYAHSERVQNSQMGGIVADRVVIFFPKNTNVHVNDVIRENATVYNGNAIRYFDVIGAMPYSQYDFLVRVDADLKNYQRGT